MVRFDSHRAVVYGGTSGNTVLDSLYVVDLETRVGEGLLQYSVCMCSIANQFYHICAFLRVDYSV